MTAMENLTTLIDVCKIQEITITRHTVYSDMRLEGTYIITAKHVTFWPWGSTNDLFQAFVMHT